MEQLLALAPNRTALQNEMLRAHHQGGLALQTFSVWNLFFAVGADQQTFAQRWEQTGGKALKNDERVLLRGKMQMRAALLEVHRIHGDGWVEAVDLFSPQPEPMRVQDRNLAGMAARFSTLLTWIFPLPHYWHISGLATPIEDMAGLTVPEVVREIVRHLGGPITEAEMRRWLAGHMVQFNDALTATLQLRQQQALTGMDAKAGQAVYELRAPFAQCRERLDALPDVEPDELSEAEMAEGFAEAREWFDPEPALKQMTGPGGRLELGRVLLGQSHWRLETFGEQKLARQRSQFEQQLGGLVRFSSQRVDDWGARRAAQGPDVDQALVPPRLLEQPQQLIMASSRVPMPAPGLSRAEAEQAILRAVDQAFLDDPVPVLDHQTPRQAAQNPALRPKLIGLMKSRVRSHDERNLQTGGTADINWMLRELGLTEIMFDPPPWRPPPPASSFLPARTGEEAEAEVDDDDDFPEDFDPIERVPVDPNRPPAPPLPAEPLTVQEASERLQRSLAIFENSGEAEAELQASGATMLDAAEQVLPDSLTEADFGQAVVFAMHTWFALVPVGCRAPVISFDAFEAAFYSNFKQLEACIASNTPDRIELFLGGGPQPNLSLVLLAGFLETTTKAPKDLRPSLAVQPLILALMKTIVEILDAALRRK